MQSSANTKKVKISGTIITFNEESNIARAVRSMQPVCDEIVVLDSFSSDRTVAIAQDLGARVVQQKFVGHIEQKNAALDLARYDVILSLDADEELSAALTKSIQTVKEDFQADGYRFNRLNNYCGQWIRYGTWYPDRKLRLWKRSVGRWGGQNPHDMVKLPKASVVHYLKGDLLHYTAKSQESYLEQVDKFSTIQANLLREQGFKPNLYHRFAKPIGRFLVSFVIRMGFLDGKAGWEIAQAQYKLVKMRYEKI
ncbi:MAG: glycosyltransferase family 2 protein [Saprospiraceae bacterium]|nr:glycosyltransferase family 2 protein [Saprospiraceae bacterium]